MAAENGIVGDNQDPIGQLPETQVPEADLQLEKQMAQFSKSPEYLRLKEYLEARIEFFR